MKNFFINLWARLSGRTALMCNTYNAPNGGRSENGVKSFRVDEAIPRYSVVKRGVGTPTDEYVQLGDSAGEEPLGFALDEVTAAEFTADAAETAANAGGGERRIGVAILGAVKGTVLVVANAAINIDALLQSAGNGKVKTAVSNGFVLGRALQPALASGDIIEIVPIYDPVKVT